LGTIHPLEAMAIFEEKYGLVEWVKRYPPIDELIFTILSQNTTDLNSAKAFQNLINDFGTPEVIAQQPVQSIADQIRVAGLGNKKSVRIKKILLEIKRQVGRYDISFLRDMDIEDAKNWLRSLDGIGPKTAAVVLCFAFGMPVMAVDTHVYRVSRRLEWIDPKISVEKAHDELESIIAPEYRYQLHVYLITHGRKICKAINPKCDECILTKKCPSSSSKC
jgi:endonuclease-3